VFSYRLGESARAAKKFLAHFGCNTTHWPVVTKHYRKAKAKLIRRLDRSTGRVVLKVGGGKTYDAFFEECTGCGLGRVVGWILEEDVANDKVSATSPLIGAYGSKPGQKLSRALAAALVKDGDNPKVASDKVCKIYDKWRASQGGHLVLSANILDILMSSYHAAFTSCHRPAGEYRAGPQMYVADKQTIVAYFYREARKDEVTGLMLPYKTWRQLVHIDLANTGAALMRHYPGTLPDATHKKLLDLVANVFGKKKAAKLTLNTDACEDFECDDDIPLYADSECTLLAPANAKSVKVRFAEVVPCAGCGKIAKPCGWLHDSLNCCSGGLRCCECDCELVGDDAPEHVRFREGDYCQSCFDDVTSTCEECGDTVWRDDAVTASNDDCLTLCVGCYDKFWVNCFRCGEDELRQDAVILGKEHYARAYCEACATANLFTCTDCQKPERNDGAFAVCRPPEPARDVCEICSAKYHYCEHCEAHYVTPNVSCPTCSGSPSGPRAVPADQDPKHAKDAQGRLEWSWLQDGTFRSMVIRSR